MAYSSLFLFISCYFLNPFFPSKTSFIIFFTSFSFLGICKLIHRNIFTTRTNMIDKSGDLGSNKQVFVQANPKLNRRWPIDNQVEWYVSLTVIDELFSGWLKCHIQLFIDNTLQPKTILSKRIKRYRLLYHSFIEYIILFTILFMNLGR